MSVVWRTVERRVEVTVDDKPYEPWRDGTGKVTGMLRIRTVVERSLFGRWFPRWVGVTVLIVSIEDQVVLMEHAPTGIWSVR